MNSKGWRVNFVIDTSILSESIIRNGKSSRALTMKFPSVSVYLHSKRTIVKRSWETEMEKCQLSTTYFGRLEHYSLREKEKKVKISIEKKGESISLGSVNTFYRGLNRQH